jgi:uncharacterized protein
MPPDAPAPRDESALCLACGLCCAGAFYDLVPLDPDEIEHAEKLRLPLSDREPRLTFRLPCPRLSGTACTIYAERPRECGRFACGVLRAYREHAIEMDEALSRVGQAKAAFERVSAGDRSAEAKQALSVARRRWFDENEDA